MSKTIEITVPELMKQAKIDKVGCAERYLSHHGIRKGNSEVFIVPDDFVWYCHLYYIVNGQPPENDKGSSVVEGVEDKYEGGEMIWLSSWDIHGFLGIPDNSDVWMRRWAEKTGARTAFFITDVGIGERYSKVWHIHRDDLPPHIVSYMKDYNPITVKHLINTKIDMFESLSPVWDRYRKDV